VAGMVALAMACASDIYCAASSRLARGHLRRAGWRARRV